MFVEISSFRFAQRSSPVVILKYPSDERQDGPRAALKRKAEAEELHEQRTSSQLCIRLATHYDYSTVHARCATSNSQQTDSRIRVTCLGTIQWPIDLRL